MLARTSLATAASPATRPVSWGQRVVVRQAGDDALGRELHRHQACQPERGPHDGGVDQVVAQAGRRVAEVEFLGLDACLGLPFAVGAQQAHDDL